MITFVELPDNEFRIVRHSKDNVEVIEMDDHKKWYDYDYCRQQLKADGLNLAYIHDQNKELCLMAVRNNGMALQYVKKQSVKICLTAVRENGLALAYVRKQTERICRTALEQEINAKFFVDRNAVFQVIKWD